VLKYVEAVQGRYFNLKIFNLAAFKLSDLPTFGANEMVMVKT
jgi:hypothetical protein